jgi:hypothetical protein
MDSFHCSGAVKKPSSLSSMVVSAMVLVGMIYAFPVVMVGLPVVGMSAPMPGTSRPGRRTCQWNRCNISLASWFILDSLRSGSPTEAG